MAAIGYFQLGKYLQSNTLKYVDISQLNHLISLNIGLKQI